jgi:hypothetical protein
MGRRYQADTDFQHTINEINKHKHLYLLPPVLTQKTQGILGEDKARSKGEESITLYRNYIILSCLFVRIVNYITLQSIRVCVDTYRYLALQQQ